MLPIEKLIKRINMIISCLDNKQREGERKNAKGNWHKLDTQRGNEVAIIYELYGGLHEI
jgi:hypothetical protein